MKTILYILHLYLIFQNEYKRIVTSNWKRYSAVINEFKLGIYLPKRFLGIWPKTKERETRCHKFTFFILMSQTSTFAADFDTTKPFDFHVNTEKTGCGQ